MVLALVLVLALLLATGITTFVHRAVIDAKIVRNRDAAAQAEALARGGVRLATGLLLQDLLLEAEAASQPELGIVQGATLDDLWARVGGIDLPTPEGTQLSLRIRDTAARLNLNALIEDPTDEAASHELAEDFLTDFLEETVIPAIPLPPGEKVYDARELAEHLIDFIDPDEIRGRGGYEDEYYQRQDPPYTAWNKPLLSVDQLRLVEGFDAPLVDTLRHYVTVYPYVPEDGQRGIDLNTAPPHVLAALYIGSAATSRHIASPETVRQILQEREQGHLICSQYEGAGDRCTPLNEILHGESIYPATEQYPAQSHFFEISSRATVGDVKRTVETVIDLSQPTEPRLLTWRVH